MDLVAEDVKVEHVDKVVLPDFTRSESVPPEADLTGGRGSRQRVCRSQSVLAVDSKAKARSRSARRLPARISVTGATHTSALRVATDGAEIRTRSRSSSRRCAKGRRSPAGRRSPLGTGLDQSMYPSTVPMSVATTLRGSLTPTISSKSSPSRSSHKIQRASTLTRLRMADKSISDRSIATDDFPKSGPSKDGELAMLALFESRIKDSDSRFRREVQRRKDIESMSKQLLSQYETAQKTITALNAEVKRLQVASIEEKSALQQECALRQRDKAQASQRVDELKTEFSAKLGTLERQSTAAMKAALRGISDALDVGHSDSRVSGSLFATKAHTTSAAVGSDDLAQIDAMRHAILKLKRKNELMTEAMQLKERMLEESSAALKATESALLEERSAYESGMAAMKKEIAAKDEELEEMFALYSDLIESSRQKQKQIEERRHKRRRSGRKAAVDSKLRPGPKTADGHSATESPGSWFGLGW